MKLDLFLIHTGVQQMSLRFIFSFVFLITTAGSAFSMQFTQADRDAQQATLARLVEGTGWVPSMARIPSRDLLRKSADQVPSGHMCIPSGVCYGTCYAPAPRAPSPSPKNSPVVAKFELPKEAKEQNERVQQLKELLKKIMLTVGKSEAIKIVKTAIDESSDSDTESAGSLSSPNGAEEDLLETLKKK